MKRFGLLLAVVALAGAALTSAVAGTQAKKKICARTTSASKPYKKVTVSGAALKAAIKNPANIVPAPSGGCPKTLLSPTAGGVAMPVALTGEAEAPAADPVATGTATFRMRKGQAQVCYQLAAKNLAPAAAAHIHAGASGASGPVVIPLNTPGADGTSSGCANTTRSLVNAILANPGGYYANVHTAEFPAGAIRGQLTGTSADSFGTIFNLDLKGTSEPNATGSAILRVRSDAGMVCYRLHAANVTLPTIAAHIHKGGASVNGPVVVPFTAPGADGNSSGCSPADPAVIADIIANPPGYYVNVHTKEHPAGAIRSQLG